VSIRISPKALNYRLGLFAYDLILAVLTQYQRVTDSHRDKPTDNTHECRAGKKYKQFVAVMLATARIATEHGSLNRIRQVAPI